MALRARAGSSQTVLVIDDQQRVILPLRRLLERAGYRVLTALPGAGASGARAVRDVNPVKSGRGECVSPSPRIPLTLVPKRTRE